MAKLNTGLGKGLGSLIPSDFDASLLMDTNERIQNVFINQIVPNPDQPRRHFEQTALTELSESIKHYGILQPLILTASEGEKYKIIAGERRWRASKIAGLTKVPAIIRDEQELEQLEIALIENVQRVDLSPLEQAVSIERLHQQFNMTYADIAKRLGKAVTTLNNIVRLLQLPPNARDALQNSKITEGHARAILALKDLPEKQTELLKRIINNSWSVRQAEQYVQTQKQGLITTGAVKKHMAHETPATRKLSKQIGTAVTINRTAKGGKLEIHFKDDEELNSITQKLSQLK